MSEGRLHALLVEELVGFAGLMLENDYTPVLVDLAGTDGASKPPLIRGFVPDLYVPQTHPIIGEAKTFRDLETDHSRAQLSGYLDYLGALNRGVLLLAVPLPAVNCARTMIRNLSRNLGLGRVPRLEVLFIGAVRERLRGGLLC